MKKQSDMKVVARSPFHIYYEGPALMVSARNEVGPFDILPGHADLFSIMSAGEVSIQTNESDAISFNIDSGIISVKQGSAILFINI